MRAAAVALAVILLAGCAPTPTPNPTTTPAEVDMTPAEAKAELVDRLTTAAEAVGGTWDHKFDREPNDCTRPDGTAGILYSLVSLGAGAADPAAAAQTVADLWTRQGYLVTMSDADGGAKEVTYAKDDTGLYFRFGATTLGSDLSGSSSCVPAL